MSYYIKRVEETNREGCMIPKKLGDVICSLQLRSERVLTVELRDNKIEERTSIAAHAPSENETVEV